MLLKKIAMSACAAVMLVGIHAPAAFAQGQPIDSRTEFTFRAPVEMPGVTLPAGAYTFRFVDATTGRRVMQVMSKDGKKSFGVFMTISAERPTASDDAELRFLETPEGTARAVKTWWYPGTKTGREFIYPKEQARRLAMATKTNVLTTKGAAKIEEKQMASADLSYVSPSGDETDAIEQTVAEVNNAAPTGTTRRADRTVAANMAGSRQSLPHTASMLPLLMLIGLTSLVGGAALFARG